MGAIVGKTYDSVETDVKMIARLPLVTETVDVTETVMVPTPVTTTQLVSGPITKFHLTNPANSYSIDGDQYMKMYASG